MKTTKVLKWKPMKMEASFLFIFLLGLVYSIWVSGVVGNAFPTVLFIILPFLFSKLKVPYFEEYQLEKIKLKPEKKR